MVTPETPVPALVATRPETLKAVAGSSGVTLLDGLDARPVPIALVAATVKVYVVQLVSPVTVIGLFAPWAVMLPGLEVTVYEMIGLLPFEAGALKLTVAWAFPAVAVTFCGAPGFASGVTLLEGLDSGPFPIAFLAFTVKVYPSGQFANSRYKEFHAWG